MPTLEQKVDELLLQNQQILNLLEDYVVPKLENLQNDFGEGFDKYSVDGEGNEEYEE